MQGRFFLLNKASVGKSFFFCCLIWVLLAGCGPSPSRLNYHLDNSSLPLKFEFAQYREDRCVLYSWYKTFDVPGLRRVVEKALENNLDIKIATWRLRELKYAYLKSSSSLYPEVNLSAGVKRQRSSYDVTLPMGRTTTITTTSNTYNIQGTVSYELDLWGKLRYERQAQKFSFLEGTQAREVVKLGVVSLAVEYYFDLVALNKKISLVRKEVILLNRLYVLACEEYNRGVGSFAQMKERENALLQGKNLLTQLIKEKQNILQRFNLLLGRYPRAKIPFMPPASIPLKVELPPVPIPSHVLERRPDIKQTLWRLRSALARYGYARAIRFPSLTLSASGGFVSNKLSTLLDPVSKIWAISADLLYPLFNAGRLKYNQKEQEAFLKETIVSYQKTVLNAFLEVESGLMTLRHLKREIVNAKNILKNLETETRLEEMRFSRGLTGAASLLEAKVRCVNEELKLIDLRLGLLKNQIFIFKAIGGGFQEKGDKKR